MPNQWGLVDDLPEEGRPHVRYDSQETRQTGYLFGRNFDSIEDAVDFCNSQAASGLSARLLIQARDNLWLHVKQWGWYDTEVASSTVAPTRPTVTTLCGSSRFPDVHMAVMMHLTLLGRVVVPMGCYGHADVPAGARFLTSDGDESTPEKRALDQLHFRKIEMSDGIFVVNPGGYIGSSTRREVEHARKLNKTVEWLFESGRF